MSLAVASAPAPSSIELPNRMLGTEDLASVFGVNVSTIREWARTGVLPRGRRLGKVLRWNPAAIRPLLSQEGA
jgi:predicted DNA-binding transcriptional regulator AlpA